MSRLLRYYRPGEIYFVACITHQRIRHLEDRADTLIECLRHAQEIDKFHLVAYVVLPDHFHAIMEPRSSDLSLIMQRIKLSFSRKLRYNNPIGPIWQKRFWDHAIRDERDFENHFHYVHFNPLHHSLVASPFDWRWSSIHQYVKEGFYQDDWSSIYSQLTGGDFGE